MNVAVYYPILKLSGLVQHEPLGLFCWQLPFGLLGTLPLPKLCSRRLQTRGFAQHHSKAGTVCTKTTTKNVFPAGTVQWIRFFSVQVPVGAT